MQTVWCGFLDAANKNANRLLFIFLVWFSFSPAMGQVKPSPTDPLISLPEIPVQFFQKNAEGNIYQIGDRINLYAPITSENFSAEPAQLQLKVPEGASPLEDQGWYLDPIIRGDGGAVKFVVSPLQSGKLTLPALLLQKGAPSGPKTVTIARTLPLSIQVAELKEKPSGSPELIDVTPIPLPLRYWVLFGLIAVAFFLALFYFLRKWARARNLRKRLESVPRLKKEENHVLALRELEQLYRKYNFTPIHLKPIAFGVSEILKTFFSSRFQIDANESTTEELLVLLRDSGLSKDELRSIRALFEKLDLIKFTDTAIDPSQQNTIELQQLYSDYKTDAQQLIQHWTLLVKKTDPKGEAP